MDTVNLGHTLDSSLTRNDRRSSRNLNDIRVRSFVLAGAPLPCRSANTERALRRIFDARMGEYRSAPEIDRGGTELADGGRWFPEAVMNLGQALGRMREVIRHFGLAARDRRRASPALPIAVLSPAAAAAVAAPGSYPAIPCGQHNTCPRFITTYSLRPRLRSRPARRDRALLEPIAVVHLLNPRRPTVRSSPFLLRERTVAFPPSRADQRRRSGPEEAMD